MKSNNCLVLLLCSMIVLIDADGVGEGQYTDSACTNTVVIRIVPSLDSCTPTVCSASPNTAGYYEKTLCKLI